MDRRENWYALASATLRFFPPARSGTSWVAWTATSVLVAGLVLGEAGMSVRGGVVSADSGSNRR